MVTTWKSIKRTRKKKIKTFGKTLVVFRIYLQKKKHEWISQNIGIINSHYDEILRDYAT